MKSFITLVVLFAVASARVLPPAVVASTDPEIQEIVAAIQSPNTDPATAAALEEMLLAVLGIAQPEPVQIEPIEPQPIEIGPAIIDFPLPDGGAVTAEPASPSPSPLLQIIIKVNKNVPGNPVSIETINPPAPTPVQVVEGPVMPEPVIVVEQPIIAPEPVIVVDKPIIAPEPIVAPEPVVAPEDPEPVIVVDKPIIAPEPVVVVDKPIIAPEPVLAPEEPEPVIIAEPIIVAPALNIPDILN